MVFRASGITNSIIPESINSFKKKLKQRIKDNFFQHWTSEIIICRKCSNYRMFATTLNLKTHLVNLSSRERGIKAKFRCRNHNLPIESGCRQGIPRNIRLCELCTKYIGDEFHHIFNCPHFEVLRNSPSSVKFETLMNVTNINQLYKLCKFIEKIIYFVKLVNK